MATLTFHNPHNLTLDAVALTGMTNITNAPNVGGNIIRTPSDNNSVNVTVPTVGSKGGVISFSDPIQAEAASMLGLDGGAAGTYKVVDDSGALYTVTMTDVKTGQAGVGFSNNAVAGNQVEYNALTISDPVAD